MRIKTKKDLKKKKKRSLDTKFENEKAVFGGISKATKEIDSLKSQAEIAKRNGDLQKAAEIEYGKIADAKKHKHELEEKW